jgi:hypothetical protein
MAEMKPCCVSMVINHCGRGVTGIKCMTCKQYIVQTHTGWAYEGASLPTEQEIIAWVHDQSHDYMGSHLVTITKFTAHFGPLTGSLLDLVLTMSRDAKVDLQCWDTWAQKEHAGEFIEGRDFIHLNQYRRGLGFINVSKR